MNKKIGYLVGLVLVFVIIVVGVKKISFSRSTTDSITIGAVISLTGGASPWGAYGKNGIDLAVKTMNASGGINGRAVKVVMEDDHTDPKQGVSAFQKLVTTDKVQGIIGGVFDFTAQPLIPLAATNDIPFISPANFHIAGGFDLNEQSFVMLSDLDKTVSKLEPVITSKSFKKMAVIHYQSTFGKEIAKTLTTMTRRLEKGDSMDVPYSQIGNNDWKTMILKLKKEGVDAVFLDMVANDPLTFMKQARQLGFAPVVITYNGALDAFIDKGDKELLENVTVLNWEVSSPAFIKLYQDEYGVLPAKSAEKYFNATYVLATALANTSRSSQASQYIATHSFVTPSGAIVFTPEHSIKDSKVEVGVVRNGSLISSSI